jgi:plastocyanin domain-containing protein
VQHITGMAKNKGPAISFRCCLVAAAFFMFVLSGVSIGQEKKYVATQDKDGVQRIEVLAGEYFFDPNYIVVKANLPVEIKIKKEPSIVPHDFVLKAPEAGLDLFEKLSTEPKIIKFTPSMPGKYQFYCDEKLLFFRSHRSHGMEGVLEVQ